MPENKFTALLGAKFVRVVSEIYKKALKVKILNEVAVRQVVRKRVSFQDREKENIKIS